MPSDRTNKIHRYIARYSYKCFIIFKGSHHERQAEFCSTSRQRDVNLSLEEVIDRKNDTRMQDSPEDRIHPI